MFGARQLETTSGVTQADMYLEMAIIIIRIL